jgi:hypothetical protein
MLDTTEEENPSQQTASSGPKTRQRAATKPKEEWAVWSEEELSTYLQFLFQHRSEMGDGSNFKKKTFSAAAEHMEQSGRASGGEKDWEACRSKWQKVCGNIILFQSFLLMFPKVKKIYEVIGDIKAHTGWTWSNETGASITVMNSDSWVNFLKKHPLAKPFRNAGWPYLDTMEEIMPYKAKGSLVFRPSQAIKATGDSPEAEEGGEMQFSGREGSLEWDIEKNSFEFSQSQALSDEGNGSQV